MANQNSFDIVSEVDLAEVRNAVNQANKELVQRYDLKNSKSRVELDDKQGELVLSSADDYTVEAVKVVLQQKLVRRGVSLKALDWGRVEPAAKETVRQRVAIQQGIPTEKAKEIVKVLKQAKLKVQAAIQGDLVRVSGKSRDALQEAIAAVKAEDFGIDMKFTNYRSN
jgi:uncharacterized protein YajQ (UPF0234 family)